MRPIFRYMTAFGLFLGIAVVDVSAQTPLRSTITLRGNLDNSHRQFAKNTTGHVAFIGGSITEMNGYRPMVSAVLQKRFSKTKFTFTNAGISSTCSTTGAFRLQSDVFSKGKVDLFFIEFAVNDDQDAGHSKQDCIRGMEGIIRQARRHNPNIDIVITYFVNPGMLEALQKGRTPLPIASHDAVAKHYDISTIHLAKEVADQISGGKLTWKKFGGTHPAPFGNTICAKMIGDLLEIAYSTPLAAKPSAHAIPTKPLIDTNYEFGHFVDPKSANVKSGWKLHVPTWKKLPGSSRSRFTSLKMLCADQPGAELTLEFTGTAIGAYIVAGPDAGVVEARIDDGPFREVNLYHRYSKGLHYPRTVMFANDLPPKRHVLTLRASKKTNSKGHAMRIMQFTVNGTSAQKSAKKLSIITLGDSITRGARPGVGVHQTFAALIEGLLAKDGHETKVVNVGIGGERTDQALKRLQTAVIAKRPDVVTIMYGTNDSYVDRGKRMSRLSLEAYRKNLQTIIGELRAAGIEPVLMTEPRWAAKAGSNGVGEHPNLRLSQYVEACRQVASEMKVPLVDHFAHWTKAEKRGVNLSDWTTDGCHPNPRGHEEIAAEVARVLRMVVDQKSE